MKKDEEKQKLLESFRLEKMHNEAMEEAKKEIDQERLSRHLAESEIKDKLRNGEQVTNAPISIPINFPQKDDQSESSFDLGFL